MKCLRMIHYVYLQAICSALIDLDLEEENEVPFTTFDHISLLSDLEDETSDEDNGSSGSKNETSEHPSSTNGFRAQEQPSRNGPVVYPFQTIDILSLQTWYLRVGDTVELHPEEYSSESRPKLGDFIYIQKIIENIV